MRHVCTLCAYAAVVAKRAVVDSIECADIWSANGKKAKSQK